MWNGRKYKRIVPLVAVKEPQRHATPLQVGEISARIAEHLYMHDDGAGLLDLANLAELYLVSKSGQHLVVLSKLAQITIAGAGKDVENNRRCHADADHQGYGRNQKRAGQHRLVWYFARLRRSGFCGTFHLHAEKGCGCQNEKQQEGKKEGAVYGKHRCRQYH